MANLNETIKTITKPNPELYEQAQTALDNLTKPPGSLGRLEELARQAVAITGDLHPVVSPKLVCTFAGDHGITQEGVSAFPAEVTPQMVFNILAGGAGVNVLSRHFGADVRIIDAGVNFNFEDADGLVHKKVAMGTANMAQGPAMTRDQAIAALTAGIEVAEQAVAEGYKALATGEMGIGNTTPATAIVAAFTGRSVAEVTGRGTGIDDETLNAKTATIEKVLKINQPNSSDAVDVLAKVGGFEIGAIAGLCLGGAALGVPVVVDGFISTAGALVACKLCPATASYLIASHKSVEIGHAAMLDEMDLKPLIDLDLRLGEGTGAAIGLGLLEASVKILNEMATFESAGVTGEQV